MNPVLRRFLLATVALTLGASAHAQLRLPGLGGLGNLGAINRLPLVQHVEPLVDRVLAPVDLAVARLLAHRLMVMRQGQVVEQGLTDQVLDDPQHPYTQLLVSSVLQA